jgi:hypothetical protein
VKDVACGEGGMMGELDGKVAFITGGARGGKVVPTP